MVHLPLRVSSLLVIFAVLAVLTACSTTQKTPGGGMVSVVAQNVVKVAGYRAVRDLDLKIVSGRKTFLEITGFNDGANRGFIESLMRNQVELVGGTLVDKQRADVTVEVIVNVAGIDHGTSSYFVGGAERSEGAFDVSILVRNALEGSRLSSQTIRGYAKYQEGSFLGIKGSGAYFVKEKGEWVVVKDPALYK